MSASVWYENAKHFCLLHNFMSEALFYSRVLSGFGRQSIAHKSTKRTHNLKFADKHLRWHVQLTEDICIRFGCLQLIALHGIFALEFIWQFWAFEQCELWIVNCILYVVCWMLILIHLLRSRHVSTDNVW